MKKLLAILLLIAISTPFQLAAQGCVEPTSDDGVQVVGYIQAQYETQFLDDGLSPMHGLKANNGFYFDRARIGVVGNIPYDFSYYVMTEFSPTKGGPYLLDAFITYKRFAPWINVSAGQFKSPFGLELSTPCQSLNTVNRSLVVSELASPFRDLGVFIYGGTGDKEIFGLKNANVLAWKFSYTNGTGMNMMDTNLGKDYTARLIFSPIAGVSIGGSYKYGTIKPTDPTMDEDVRSRYGFDISVEKANFLVQAEYINGSDQGSSLVGGGCGETPTLVIGDFIKNGFFVQALYMTPWNIQPVVKFESYDPDADVDFNKQNDFTFGFNYFFNEWTRLQANYVYRTEESSDTVLADYNEVGNDFFVLQLQVKF
ncbi:MAG: porin [Bacteroidales bacterium]|jgi:hypothetical protein|nr:porin [Bacteroidales bacterium]